MKKIDRRSFVKTAGAAVVGISALGINSGKQVKQEIKIKRKPGATPRNIIVIVSDDHRYDFMSFFRERPELSGNTPSFLETPNMDKMANNGAHIKDAFVTTSLCSPSRASILTGLFSHKHKVVDNTAPVPDDITFFPQYLQQAGYETAMIGKWHMGESTDVPRKGFDKWISFTGQGVYYDPLFNIDGEHVQREGYITDLLTDYAVDWINQEREKPFFLYLSHKAVHSEFEPAKRHLGKYENEKINYPASMANTEENYKNKPDWVKAQRNSWHGVDYLYQGAIEFDPFYKRYCETLLGVDDSIGTLFETLKEKEMLDSTFVLYLGDNGFCLGEHGLIDKRQMYEESIRIPMLAHCPEIIKQGSTINGMIQNIDIAPTVMELAGLEKPEYMDGESFLPLLKGEEIKWRDEIYYEYFWERPFPHTPTVFGIRTDKYKYMTYHGIWDIDELYDIENDPKEMYNLINDKEHQEIIKALRDKVYTWLETTNGMQIPLKRTPLWQANERKPMDEQ